MRKHLKDLKVAVVPTETNNTIDQSSDVDSILACEDTVIYSITDYFKAQNDEELGLHWSFLIDVTDSVEYKDITGCNIEGVHQKYEPRFMERFNSLYDEALEFIEDEMKDSDEIIIIDPFDAPEGEINEDIYEIDSMFYTDNHGQSELYKPYKITKLGGRCIVHGFDHCEMGEDVQIPLDIVDWSAVISIAHEIS